MPYMAIEGIYESGKVELDEQPIGVDYSPVTVVFLSPHRLGGARQSGHEAAEGAESRDDILSRVLGRMERGVPLGGPPYPTREELHDRLRRFE